MAKLHGFGKDRRITDSGDIKRLIYEGNLIRGKYIDVKYLPESEKKFTIRLQNGVSGGVLRNKLRRRLREIVRKFAGSLKEGLYLIKGKRKAVNVEYPVLLEDFKEIISNGGLWQK